MAMKFSLRMLEWSQTPKDSEAGLLFSGNVKMFRGGTLTEILITFSHFH